MQNETVYQNDDHLSKVDLSKLIIDLLHRTIIHYGMWYAEVYRQLGKERAEKIIENVSEEGYKLQIKRLAKTLGFELDEETAIPKYLLNLSHHDLLKLKESVAINWLALDGIWFQSVENENENENGSGLKSACGMFDAKRCNDSCWAQFSPFEAASIKKFLKLQDNSGLEGLKSALKFRLYASINKQSIVEEKVEESESSFVFRMDECRVQSARKRKGLEDYPCKSAGVVEYSSFAFAIDSRIVTECIGCPPDKHPEEWSCSWRFSIKNKAK
ncbi:MAG: cytosolic protein [Oligoflexia bacterium]|nr:cytosolic protein [Oligoflexia bacterium]